MGKLKGLIGIAFVAGFFYVAWNLIPPYFNNYQLQDELDDIARKNSYTRYQRMISGRLLSEKLRRKILNLGKIR